MGGVKMEDDEIRKAVRDTYAEIARQSKPSVSAGDTGCCGTQETVSEAGCCSPQEATKNLWCGCGTAEATSRAIGYSTEELGKLPEGANLGLGCGNPAALASLKEGEVILDLGSGGGIDCFLAANAVGQNGSVIGVDMTPEMVETARENARKGGYQNVEFRLGEIENLPVADNSVDVVISNCVINLSPAKDRVFREAYRALKTGGRVMVSDIVLLKELPESVRNSVAAYAACVGGASRKEEYLATVAAAGFKDVEIMSEVSSGMGELAETIVSISVRAVKPE